MHVSLLGPDVPEHVSCPWIALQFSIEQVAENSSQSIPDAISYGEKRKTNMCNVVFLLCLCCQEFWLCRLTFTEGLNFRFYIINTEDLKRMI
jgi:hypothetical protein